jgi:hypothetical protein
MLFILKLSEQYTILMEQFFKMHYFGQTKERSALPRLFLRLLTPRLTTKWLYFAYSYLNPMV